MLTGRRLEAAEALSIGLVADVLEPEGLLERALQAAGEIAALAPWGVRLTKRGMWSALEIPSEQAAVEYEDRQQIIGHLRSGGPRGDRGLPPEAPCRVRRLADERALRRLRQDRARHGRLARDRADDRARSRAGGRARDRLFAQERRRRGGRAGARRARRLRGDPGRRRDNPRGPRRSRRRRWRASRRSTSSSTTRAPRGARRSRSSPRVAGTRSCTTNVEGVFHLTVALLPALRAAAKAEHPSRVINIGSIDGLRTPSVENYSYGASKGRRAHAHPAISPSAWPPSTSRSTRSRPVRSRAK